MTEDKLRAVPIFAKLDEEELLLVDKIGVIKHFPNDRLIFLEGDAFTGFYVILMGAVKIYKLSSDGTETVLHILGPYKSFAETPLFTNSDIYPACAQTIDDSALFYIPRLQFKRLMEESSSLALKISEAFAVRLMELNKKFGQLSVNVEGRLARYIVNEINLNGTIKKPEPVFTLVISKKDLAAQLGIAVETLSRNLRKLKDDKVIRESSKKIFVLDLKRLQTLAE